MLDFIVIIVLVLLIGLLLYAATKPDTFSCARSIDIDAAPDKIFPLINDLQAWEGWTPYNKDPLMKKSFSGNSVGPGASYAWDGNKDVGQGNIEISSATPPRQIVMQLNIIKPFAGQNRVEFTLEPQGGATRVTWAMSGAQPFIGKVVSLFINCEKMVTSDWDIGLGNLKALAEKS